MDATASKSPRRRVVLRPTTHGDLPVGTLTFLMTDIDGSTKVSDKSPGSAKLALERHDRIVVDHVEKNQGKVVESGREGDRILAVFRQARDAVLCSVDLQRSLALEAWPGGVELRARIALHTGEAELSSGHYIGAPLDRCARLMATAYGGQIVISRATEELITDHLPLGVGLRDLGQHRLRDMTRSEHVFQVTHGELRSDFPPLKSLEVERTNLAKPLTSFVGRQSELNALKRLVKESRLVTLLGPGGIGKSRIAVQLSRASLDLWQDGAWWIDLTPVEDPNQVSGTISAALRLLGMGSPSEKALAWLSHKKVLLVIDNCEHVIQACATFCESALASCPGLTIVATSREPMGVSGEVRWPLAALSEIDAESLFAERARLVAPGFEVTPANRHVVSDICRRLDRLPLAIELAASRLGLMGEREIANHLQQSFRLLSMDHGLDRRHATMSAAIEWSYRLLTDAEALLLRRLAVFRGGFSLESAEAVCSDSQMPNVLESLHGLVRKSTVVVERLDDESTRYRLLEVQMEFAEDKLSASGELNRIQRRHYNFFAAAMAVKSDQLGLSGKSALSGLNAAMWTQRELANLWAAVRWARLNTEERGLGLAAKLALEVAVDLNRARSWLSELMAESPVSGTARHRALLAASNLAHIQGDYEVGVELARQAERLARVETNDPAAIAASLRLLAAGLVALGQWDAGRTVIDEALQLLKGSDNGRLVAMMLNADGLLALMQGRFVPALETLRDAVKLSEPYDDAELAWILESLANAELACGDRENAEQSWKRSMSISRRFGDIFNEHACLGGLSRIAALKQDYARAIRLAAAHQQISENASIVDGPYWETELIRAVQLCRGKLGPRKSDEAWQKGAEMSLDGAVAYALDEHVELAVERGPLSRRQAEVTKLVAAGMTNREIARRLFLSERTVESHLDHIRNKLGFRSRTEVATWAVTRAVANRD